MALDLMKERRAFRRATNGFTWRDMVRTPVSKLDDDAFTKVKIF